MDKPLAPWLHSQLTDLLAQRGHALLLSGPSGLGQFELGLALSKAWLCDAPLPTGACGQCASCHAVQVHTHADLCVVIPEVLALEWGYPLDEKTLSDLDGKKRKPSKEIKVEGAREVVSFTQTTRSRSQFKVVLVYPAERMNLVTANTLLKTLEEPPGQVKFILASDAAHQLLPTLRSRCINHALTWPKFEDALAWLAGLSSAADTRPALADLETVLRASGSRPLDAWSDLQHTSAAQCAERWRALPQAMARGDASALSDSTPRQAIDALQKLCCDLLASSYGAAPRFFEGSELSRAVPKPRPRELSAWFKELSAAKGTAEHPFSAPLMLEALASRAQSAMRSAAPSSANS